MQQIIVDSLLPATLPVTEPAVFPERHILAITPIRDLVGAEIFYVLSSGDSAGQRRPGVIVKDWGNSRVNLQVFTDGLNDFAVPDPGSDGLLWATSVQYAPGHTRTPGTWHWRTETF